mgnify:FL=1
MVISKGLRKILRKFMLSRRGLAIPVTFLILFVSLLTLISATYYFAIAKVKSKSRQLNVAVAKESMISLESHIMHVAWSEGASEIYVFDDCGGKLETKPLNVQLTINVSNGNFSETVYDCLVGEVVYELPAAESVDIGLFLKGDYRVVVNQSGSVMTRLFITNGVEKPEIRLYYRPMVSIAEIGSEDGRPLNYMRIYVINLNSSQSFESQGEVPVKVSCLEVVSELKIYNFTSQISSLNVKAILNGESGQISVPISSNANGAILQVEVLTCQIKIERVQR